MERNSNENFEHFLRQNAEDFRMHPSPKVWEGISENLNKKKTRAVTPNPLQMERGIVLMEI